MGRPTNRKTSGCDCDTHKFQNQSHNERLKSAAKLYDIYNRVSIFNIKSPDQLIFKNKRANWKPDKGSKEAIDIHMYQRKK